MKKHLSKLLLSFFALVFCINAKAQTNVYVYTGAVQTYTVAAGITSITVDARGGNGGYCDYTYTFAAYLSRGGYGARVVCSLAVTPGQVLNVYVGGNGDTSRGYYYSSLSVYTGHGGWNGGGDGHDGTYEAGPGGGGGGGGGGASDIRIGGTSLTNRVIVAGGGGGGGFNCTTPVNNNRGGDGGGLTGENGLSCNASSATYAGCGGTPSAGGAGATSGGGCSNSGTLGFGGNTDSCAAFYYATLVGGGGGGGYYGGGSGYYGGGGGGSSYADATLTSSVVHTRGYDTTLADSIIITVNCSGGVINGLTSICTGSSTTLSDTVAAGSGTWSSSNTAVATVSSSSGVVEGLSAGTATITYSVTAYCGSVYSVATVTVYPVPAVIAGAATICTGATAVLSDLVTGGTWSSGSTGIATIGSLSGVVTGAAAGTSIITYSIGGTCSIVTSETIDPSPAPITGMAQVCPGLTTNLSDISSGGTWTSGSTTIATTGASTGIVTGATAGTATIIYTQGGCTAITILTVNALPSPITGSASFCAGLTITLGDITTAGTWSSSNTAVASVTGTTIVSGFSPGTSTITYTLPTGCTATAIVTVTALSTGITGTSVICGGATTTLIDAVTGGTWASSSPSIATAGLSTGIVTGGNILFTTTAIITYTAPGGCSINGVVTVNALPNPIAGPPNVCAGLTALLSDAGDGSWTSSNTLMATVGSSNGVVGGVSAAGGTVTITYTLNTGCDTTATITILPAASPITGAATICTGGSATLSDASTGGYWQSSNASIATIDPFLGTVTGETAGVDTISYIAGCTAFTTVTVAAAPPPITGPATVCTGSGITLLEVATGGTWSSSSTSSATVGPTTGIVTGGVVTPPASSGAATITYTAPSGCSAFAEITIYPPPNPITGTLHVCSGQSTSLSDPPGGGTWSSGNLVIASITAGPTGGGITTGGSPGADTITYTQPGTGCKMTTVVTVNSAPGSILGTLSMCAGLCQTLTDATSGGTWTSSNTAVATAGSVTGMVCGAVAGTSIITYSLGGTCVATSAVTVNALPTLFSVTGGGSYCAGGSGMTAGLSGSTVGIHYQLYLGGTAAGGYVTGTGAAISFGTEPAAGNYTVIATNPVTGCSRPMTGTVTITITPVPEPYIVTGGGSYCAGSAMGVPIGLDSSAAGVTYKLYNGATLVVTVTGTSASFDFGTFLGAGTYVVTAASGGCTASMTGSATITINPLPSLFTVTGGATICPGGAGQHVGLNNSTASPCISYQLFNGATPAGTAIAGTGGALDFGPQNVAGAYTVIATNTCTGCTKVMTGSATITISAVPAISGASAVCAGATATESAPGFTGGTWSSSNTAAATVSTTGLVTGGSTSGSTTTITYTTTSGCTATIGVTVSSSPGAITGPNVVCAGATALENDLPAGGEWSASPGSVATVVSLGSLSGTVTGVGTGTVTITYSLGGTGCTVNKIMTVTPSPSAITGATSLCEGATTTLTDAATGGTWTSSNTSTAGISGGIVSGTGAGTSTIIYTLGGCTAAITLTVNAAPGAITGLPALCAGTTMTLYDATSGGTWMSSNTSAATVDAGGNVWGLLSGTTTISYSLGGSCAAAKVVTVNPISPITGSTGICVGTTTTLSDGTGSGTWTSTNTTAAPITTGVGSTSIITGVSAGTSTIIYTTADGCTATVIVTVNTAPTAISGNMHVCIGTCTHLSDTASGGTWTSSNTAVATADGSGNVCGLIAGITSITYSLGFGCTKTTIVTVNPAPPAVTGTMHMCAGTSTILNDATTGGTWESDNTTVATATGLTGAIWGASPGTAIITYSPPSGCSINTTITVNALPSPISGAASLCMGTAETLTDATSDGTWSSSNISVATVGITSGIAGSILAGTATITYTLPTGCLTSTPVAVNTATAPISGAAIVCIGSTTILSDPGGSGAWSSSNTTIATINSTGIVSGIALGTSTISFTASACPATVVVTVNSLPGAISGVSQICAGSTAALSDAPYGGSWSSTVPGIAVIGETTGMLTGVAAGVTTIAYSMGAGCMVTTTVTVEATPLPITGITEVCRGYTTHLSDGTGGSGGIWSSSNTAVATITASGIVNGLAGGPSTISYTNSAGCAATRLVTVVAVPAISGAGNMCAFGVTLPLYDSAAGGFWTSTLASISSSGVVTAYSAGEATITYTLPLGCYTTATLTINPLPGPVLGLNHLCLGSTMTVSDTSSSGVWSSNNTAVAPVSATGVVSGSFAGVCVISYTAGTGCAATKTITVDVFPSSGTISGLSVVCAGSDIVLADVATGGVWSAANTTATVLGGLVSGVSAGVDIISYTVSNSCGSVTAAKTITVNPLPAAGLISGPSTVCTGDSIVLTDTAPGGAWSTGAGATVAGGIVSGVSAGTDTIKYSVSNSCGIAYASKTITVNTLPDSGAISGIDSLCMGLTYPLLDAVTGGVWVSSNDHISISVAGIISAVSPGPDTITYALTNTCGTAATSITVAVKSGPTAGVITGNASICSGASDTLTGNPTGGNWSVSDANATITATPAGVIINGVSAGADTIIYTITNECGQATAILPATVFTIEECDSMTEVAPSPTSPGEAAEMFRVWPNPNDGVFTVILSSNTNEPVRLVITDMAGDKAAEISSVTNKATEIRLNAAAGVYFIAASTVQGNYVVKLVVDQ